MSQSKTSSLMSSQGSSALFLGQCLIHGKSFKDGYPKEHLQMTNTLMQSIIHYRHSPFQTFLEKTFWTICLTLLSSHHSFHCSFCKEMVQDDFPSPNGLPQPAFFPCTFSFLFTYTEHYYQQTLWGFIRWQVSFCWQANNEVDVFMYFHTCVESVYLT